MRARQAREILLTLIAGKHPVTGATLSSDSPMHDATVMRALLLGVDALKSAAARDARRAGLPPNVGKPWSEEELARLLNGRRAGLSLEQLASEHGRTVRAIETRLQLMDPESAGDTTSRAPRAGARPHSIPPSRRSSSVD